MQKENTVNQNKMREKNNEDKKQKWYFESVIERKLTSSIHPCMYNFAILNQVKNSS